MKTREEEGGTSGLRGSSIKASRGGEMLRLRFYSEGGPNEFQSSVLQQEPR